MKILVTGGAGFIGSHVVDAYIKAGHSVAVIDNLSTGTRANLNPRARFYKADIRNSVALQRIMRIEKPEIINHQAAIVSVTVSTKNPLLTYEVNVLGTINLLQAGAPFIRKFIFASTGGALYARPKKFPAKETEIPTPLSAYGLSKYLAEQTVSFYAKQFGFFYTILRPSNVFGPRQNPYGESGVIAIFSHHALYHQQPTIYRRQTTRDYVYVGDLAHAYVLALKKGNGEIINVGTGIETSNDAIYRMIANEFKWQQKPIYKPARPGELRRSVLAIQKARRILGWKPIVSLRLGLKNIHLHGA